MQQTQKHDVSQFILFELMDKLKYCLSNKKCRTFWESIRDQRVYKFVWNNLGTAVVCSYYFSHVYLYYYFRNKEHFQISRLF